MNLDTDFVKSIKPRPTVFKQQLKQLSVTVGAIARYINRSYPHTCNMLNGIAPTPPEIEHKLREFIEKVKSST